VTQRPFFAYVGFVRYQKQNNNYSESIASKHKNKILGPVDLDPFSLAEKEKPLLRFSIFGLTEHEPSSKHSRKNEAKTDV
jgi:hypothetical protein